MMRGKAAREGTVIYTDFQEAGKGQSGNTWESEAGKNLTFSVILFPGFLKADQNFFLNVSVALAVYDSLQTLLGIKLTVKWPNDLYYAHQKLGGILIENTIRAGRIEGSVAGIGLNIMQENFQSGKAISLRNIIPMDHDRIGIFRNLIICLDHRYDQLRNGDFRKLKRDYLSVLYRYNEPGYFKSTEKFLGRITGIDEYGRLIIETGGSTRVFSLKEVEFLEE